MWRIYHELGKKKSTAGYVLLNDDKTYLWGIDSSQSESMKNTIKGTWELTSKPEIKFIPDDINAQVKYFVQREDTRYDYYAYDKDGVKTQETSLEMMIYIEKISGLNK